MSDSVASEMPGSHTSFRFSTTDIRNILFFVGLLISVGMYVHSVSSAVERLNDLVAQTIEEHKKLSEKVAHLDTSGTAAFKAHLSEIRSIATKLETLDNRTIEQLVKIQAIDTSLNELKGFAGLKR